MPRPARDSRPLTGPQRELVASYLGLALGIARRSARPRDLSLEFCRDAAVDGLIRAARTFDPGRDRQFAGYARVLIRWQIADAARHASHPRRRPAVAVVSLIPQYFEASINRRDTPIACPASDDEARATEAIESVEHLLRILPDRHARVCRLYYLHGRTMAEAAAEIGCSQARACGLHAEAIAWLRDAAGAPRPTGPRRRLRHAGPSPRAHP